MQKEAACQIFRNELSCDAVLRCFLRSAQIVSSQRKKRRLPMPTKKKTKTKASGKRWSAKVSEHSDALDLQAEIFKQRSARQIALSLKHSAEASQRRKGSVRQSATSMLNFYIHRAGKNLSATRKRTLERAKEELRKLFESEKSEKQ